jgi:hypothetical protein
MNTKAFVHEAILNFEKSISDDRDVSTASVRLLKLVSQTINYWKDSDSLPDVGSMTDSELLTKFAIGGTIAKCIDSREQRKRDKRITARINFLTELGRFGGLMKAKAVSELIKSSRQTVNNHIKTGKLIAIKDGSDYLIPGFQFNENGKLKNLEDIIIILGDASPEAKCSFFINPIMNFGSVKESPLSILSRECSAEELVLIKREAELFLTQTAS